MNYVESFNLFGTEVKQIPCIKASGAPTDKTEGAVGCFYMDTDTGDIYKCTSDLDGVYTWASDNPKIIDDTNMAEDKAWSSSKTNTELNNVYQSSKSYAESYTNTKVGEVINDTAVTDKAWSSQNTIDKLCPSFSESGSAITCKPVEGYPLGVVTQFAPIQSGSGDPSPENIRPISGHTTCNLYHCGKNLLDEENLAVQSGYYTDTNGSLSGPNASYVRFGTSTRIRPNTKYTLSGNLTIYSITFWQTGVGRISRLNGGHKNAVTFTTPENCDGIRVSLDNTSGAADTVAFEWAQLELGDTATEHEPYRGDAFTIDLGQTVYGGSLDWKTGVLTMDWYCKTFDGTEAIQLKGSESDNFLNYRFQCYADRHCKSYKDIAYSSHYPHNTDVYGESVDNYGFIVYGPYAYIRLGSVSEITTVAQFKTFLAEQYAAGTPVQVCYQLSTPISVQLTPTEVLALSDTNYLCANTGDTTVTGKADPAAVIEKLTNAIIALGGNV